MAFTYEVASHRVAPVNLLRAFTVTVGVSSEAYATPTGITIDIATRLAALGIAHADVLFVVGRSALGHLAAVTKSATNGQFTVRLWNGTTEIDDGSITQTLTLHVFAAAGAPE